MKKPAFLAVFVVLATSLSVSMLVAFSGGAETGRSGGPAGYEFGDAGNCTACHPFNSGAGSVELLGAPRRYRAGASYELTVRISDPQQAGAGFEISAEGSDGHMGVFSILNAAYTRNAGFAAPIRYVTHTRNGYEDSLLNWALNGGSYEYRVGWEAPATDEGSLTFFLAGNAVNNAKATSGDRYYATYATVQYADPGDVDGDRDVDLIDHQRLAGCLGGPGVPLSEGCEYADADADGYVDLSDAAVLQATFTGPTSTVPADYFLADAVRGGLLYDKWWKVNGASEPTGDHQLWAFRPDMKSNTRTGSATWRCKECHGWDYKGRDGAYGFGSNHRTGIAGVENTTLGPQQLFDLLKADDPKTGGHNMDAAGMSDGDLWDVVKMVLKDVIDTDLYIDESDSFAGDVDLGNFWFNTACASCHGFEGTDINFHTDADPEYVGTVAAGNPWEFLHKIRFGHPGAPMPSLELLGWSLERASDIGTYAATLPP